MLQKHQKKKAVTEEETTVNTDTEQQGEIIMYPQLKTEVAANEALVIMNTSMGD